MKKIITYVTLTFLALFQSSLFAQEKCKYTYDPERTTLEWTAFKFTEKTGVKGGIQKVDVQKTKKADSVLDVLKDLTFIVRTDSINSNNPERDTKIKTYFFGSVKNGSEFKGNFSKITKSETGGSANLNLEFNKSKHSIPVKYEIADQTIVMTGSIDVVKFGLGKGLDKLNEVCSDLHKGADGKSKLWPTVDIKVTSILSKECNP
jgi:hypothetical protein